MFFFYDVILYKKWLRKSNHLFFYFFFESLSVSKTPWVSIYSSSKSKKESFNLLNPPADDLEDFLVSLYSTGFLLLTSVKFKSHPQWSWCFSLSIDVGMLLHWWWFCPPMLSRIDFAFRMASSLTEDTGFSFE